MPVVPFRADLTVPAREGVLDLIGRNAADFARLAHVSTEQGRAGRA